MILLLFLTGSPNTLYILHGLTPFIARASLISKHHSVWSEEVSKILMKNYSFTLVRQRKPNGDSNHIEGCNANW